MEFQQARADAILANFAAGFNAGINHANTRETQLRAVVAITSEVERHAGAIDPRETTAVSVLVDLVVELAQGMRHLANIMDTDTHPAPIILDYPVEGPEWPASLMDPEVAA